MDTSCEDWWAAAAPGEDGATEGASQTCYGYHLGVAQSMETEEDVALHCGHAMGAAPCVDPEPTFCESWTATCGEWMMDTSCEDWWAAAAPGEDGATEGASQTCYGYHLGVAQSMETEEDVALHCGHAMGAAPCVDPEPTFCESWTATCGEWMMDTSCEDWWAAAAPGEDGATEGASQTCYGYHLGVAQSMETEEDVALHCGHAMGAAPCVDPEPTEPGACYADQGYTCNPNVADSCDTANGEACDEYNNDFICYPGNVNTAKVGESCGAIVSKFCEHGLHCPQSSNTCTPFCCSDDECGMGEVCGQSSTSFLICEPVQPDQP